MRRLQHHTQVHAPCHCRDQLIQKKTHLLVDLEHIRTENRQLAVDLESRPAELLPLVSSQ